MIIDNFEQNILWKSQGKRVKLYIKTLYTYFMIVPHK